MISDRKADWEASNGNNRRSRSPLSTAILYFCFLIGVLNTVFLSYSSTGHVHVPIILLSTPVQPDQYYPWNDGRDYDKICSLTKQYIGQTNAKPLILYGSTGGLGHKYTCFLHDIGIAISGKRPIQIYMPEAFWNSTNPCFTDRHGEDITGIRLCTREHPCLTETNRVIDVNNQLENEVYAFSDERPPRILVTNSTIISDLKSYGLLEPNDTFYDYDRMMLRLFLNPSTDLRHLILQERRRIFAQRPVLGVQIRTAGLLADRKERISFINETALQEIPQLIMDTIEKYKFAGTLKGIYLSSDSQIAEGLVNRTIGVYYPILTTNLFKRGHTTSHPADTIVKRAMVDVFMLAECDGLLTTKGSGFGAVSSILAATRKKSTIPITRQLIQNFTQIRKQKGSSLH